MRENFPLKKEFKKYCENTNFKSIDSYCAYINQGLLQCKLDLNLFAEIEKNIKDDDIETLKANFIEIENYFFTKIPENKIWGDRISGIRKYIEFLEFYINKEFKQNNNPLNNDDFQSDLEEDFLENDENECIIFNDNTFEGSLVLSNKKIKENFYFRLTTQNRFPKEGIFYPIGFLKQIFYKRVKNELFDNFINQQIENIKINIENGKQIKFSEFSNLIINENNVVVEKNVIYSYNYDKKEYEKLKIKNFKEIEIDHDRPMKILLIEKANELKTLKEISSYIKKELHKPLSYKKLRKKATDISKTDFIKTINLDELLKEMHILNNSSDLVLMHRKHNNKKRTN